MTYEPGWAWGFLWEVTADHPGVPPVYVKALTAHGALRVAEADHPHVTWHAPHAVDMLCVLCWRLAPPSLAVRALGAT